MCINSVLRIRELKGTTACMEDGRTVRLGRLTDIEAGDYLEVFADIAFAKVSATEGAAIGRARKNRRIKQ